MVKTPFLLQVVTRMSELSVDCPSSVERNVSFECKVTLLRGSDVTLEVDFGDGSSIGRDSPFVIPGARASQLL